METGRKKCIVMGCENHADEGKFVGDLCSPCHIFVTSGRGVHSQAYRNARQIGLSMQAPGSVKPVPVPAKK
jgi:hypothetical protein